MHHVLGSGITQQSRTDSNRLVSRSLQFIQTLRQNLTYIVLKKTSNYVLSLRFGNGDCPDLSDLSDLSRHVIGQRKVHLRCFGYQRVRDDLRLSFKKVLDNGRLAFKLNFLSFVFLLQMMDCNVGHNLFSISLTR